jgi:SnoaL-like domain
MGAHGMTEGKTAGRLDFEALRIGIERRDPDLVLGFYAEGAKLSIANAEVSNVPPFELRGKAEIAKHLQAVYAQRASHRVDREVADEGRATFRERCEYPDGGRVVVETTLEVRDGKIVRQVDVVARNARPDGEEEAGRGPPGLNPGPLTRPGADANPPEHLRRSKQATEKEDSR